MLQRSEWLSQPKGLKLLDESSQHPVRPLTAVRGPPSNPRPRLETWSTALGGPQLTQDSLLVQQLRIVRPDMTVSLPNSTPTVSLPNTTRREVGSTVEVWINPCCHWCRIVLLFPLLDNDIVSKATRNRGHVVDGSLLSQTSWPLQPRGYTLQGGQEQLFPFKP